MSTNDDTVRPVALFYVTPNTYEQICSHVRPARLGQCNILFTNKKNSGDEKCNRI